MTVWRGWRGEAPPSGPATIGYRAAGRPTGSARTPCPVRFMPHCGPPLRPFRSHRCLRLRPLRPTEPGQEFLGEWKRPTM